MSITTHILDLARGRPAPGIEVDLETAEGPDLSSWRPIGNDRTNQDGRAENFFPQFTEVQAGLYRLTFHTADYFAALDTATFYPRVVIEFHVPDATQHYHVPLLLRPFGSATYRGS